MMRKFRMGLVGAAALATAAFVIPAGGVEAQSTAPKAEPAAVAPAVAAAGESGTTAASCSGTRTKKVEGATLKYKECSSNGKRSVTGTVNDTKANGRCAEAKVLFVPSGVYDKYKDCGGKVTKIETGYWKAADAKVYLTG